MPTYVMCNMRRIGISAVSVAERLETKFRGGRDAYGDCNNLYIYFNVFHEIF